jgi:hypothetical protein
VRLSRIGLSSGRLYLRPCCKAFLFNYGYVGITFFDIICIILSLSLFFLYFQGDIVLDGITVDRVQNFKFL